MSAARARRRHRPRHHALRARRASTSSCSDGDAACAEHARRCRSWSRPGRSKRARSCRRSCTCRTPSELAAGALALPWPEHPRDCAVGELARARGAKSALRLVSSAKSWLCHPARRSPRADPAARARRPRCRRSRRSRRRRRYLEHLRSAWDHAHPDAPLDEQDGHAHRAGVVRRGGARAHGRGRARRRARPTRCCSRSRRPRSTLARQRTATAGASRCSVGRRDPGRRRRRRHHRLLADRGARASRATWSSSASRSATTSCSAATTWTSRSPIA